MGTYCTFLHKDCFNVTSDRKFSFNYEELIQCAKGKLFGPGNAQLPMPPMLMFDRITHISDDERQRPARTLYDRRRAVYPVQHAHVFRHPLHAFLHELGIGTFDLHPDTANRVCG